HKPCVGVAAAPCSRARRAVRGRAAVTCTQPTLTEPEHGSADTVEWAGLGGAGRRLRPGRNQVSKWQSRKRSVPARTQAHVGASLAKATATQATMGSAIGKMPAGNRATKVRVAKA